MILHLSLNSSDADTLDSLLRSEQQYFHFKSSSHIFLHTHGHCGVWLVVNHYRLQKATATFDSINLSSLILRQVGMQVSTRAQTAACPFNKCLISPKLIFSEEDAGYMCQSGALHKALILTGLLRRCCSVRSDAFCWSHIINLRSLFLAAFFIMWTQALFSPKQILTFWR